MAAFTSVVGSKGAVGGLIVAGAVTPTSVGASGTTTLSLTLSGVSATALTETASLALALSAASGTAISPSTGALSLALEVATRRTIYFRLSSEINVYHDPVRFHLGSMVQIVQQVQFGLRSGVRVEPKITTFRLNSGAYVSGPPVHWRLHSATTAAPRKGTPRPRRGRRSLEHWLGAAR